MNPEPLNKLPLSINSFDDLVSHESEIVRRINTTPNGGHLFLIDPLRFLKSVGVTVGSSALKEWRERLGNPMFGKSSHENTFAAVRNARGSRTRFTFRALVRKS
jgi:hypothetical protein